MKNKTKFNEKLIAGVKAMIDKDAQISTQEIAESLSTGSAPNIFEDQLH